MTIPGAARQPVTQGLLARHKVTKLSSACSGDGQPPLLEEVLDLIAGQILADIELKEGRYETQAMALMR